MTLTCDKSEYSQIFARFRRFVRQHCETNGDIPVLSATEL